MAENEEIEASYKTPTSTTTHSKDPISADVDDELSSVVWDTFSFTDDDDDVGSDETSHNLVVDIDAADVDDELAAVEYVKDMYRFYDATEDDGRVDHDYMGSQTEINENTRAILVDWLIDVHEEHEFMPEVLYLAVNIVDRFLSARIVPRKELQLVGLCSMIIACKYEHDDTAPDVSDFIEASGNSYVREEVLRMEEEILGKLEWRLSVPTPYVYLVRFIKASIPGDENMAFFYAELGLMDYRIAIGCKPSMLAASAVYAARCTLKRSPLWTETLRYYTGYQLVECAELLVGYHWGVGENKLKVVSWKYSNPERGAVALLPPAWNLIHNFLLNPIL